MHVSKKGTRECNKKRNERMAGEIMKKRWEGQGVWEPREEEEEVGRKAQGEVGERYKEEELEGRKAQGERREI